MDAPAAPNENADTSPIQDDEVPSTEVDEMEEEEGSGEPELKGKRMKTRAMLCGIRAHL